MLPGHLFVDNVNVSLGAARINLVLLIELNNEIVVHINWSIPASAHRRLRLLQEEASRATSCHLRYRDTVVQRVLPLRSI